MTSYDHDPRVRVLDEFFVVVTGDDKYDVYAKTSADRWFTTPSLDSRSISVAALRSREETEAWLSRRRSGPFPSRDAAIASLIGPPR